MNMSDIKLSLGRSNLYLQKHSPEILLGAGLIGVVATVFMAIKAAKKDTIKEQHEIDMMHLGHVVAENNLSKEEEMQASLTIHAQTGLKYAKLYGPTISVGALSLVAILSSHGVMANRQVALIGAYNLAVEGYKNYRQRVLEEYGEEKDRQFHLGLHEQEYTVKELNDEGKMTKKKVKSVVTADYNMPSMYARCFDNTNHLYQSSRLLNQAFIAAQERYINDVLIIRGYVFLNEAYERLGFPWTPEGQLVGWVLRSPQQMKKEQRDGYVSFGLNDSEASREFMRGENDAVWLDFNVDGVVFDLIER